jgi:hypothetical protein
LPPLSPLTTKEGRKIPPLPNSLTPLMMEGREDRWWKWSSVVYRDLRTHRIRILVGFRGPKAHRDQIQVVVEINKCRLWATTRENFKR